MKEEIKDPGQELIEIDEQGNQVEKVKADKKTKSNYIYKFISAIIIFILILCACYYFFYYKKNNKNVFDEKILKNLKLKNRVIFGPSSHTVKNIEPVAKNDVALVITEGATVSDFTPWNLQPEGSFRIDSDEYIPEIKKLADAVHKYNSYILLGLGHQGMLAVEPPIYSPSGGNGLLKKELESKPMTKDEILRIEDKFVEAALRAKKAGFDGVEIHGAQYSLISLFLSQIFNKRTDEYGGSDENRARFIVEIVKKVRKAIGNDMIISAKIDCTDENYGFSESGFLTAGKELEKAGLDLIEASGPNPIRDGDMFFYEETKKLAENLNIPVICLGGIKTYDHADYILKNSKIEYIGMARALLKQPDIVKKWQANK